MTETTKEYRESLETVAADDATIFANGFSESVSSISLTHGVFRQEALERATADMLAILFTQTHELRRRLAAAEGRIAELEDGEL
jgi:hypothetical protein